VHLHDIEAGSFVSWNNSAPSSDNGKLFSHTIHPSWKWEVKVWGLRNAVLNLRYSHARAR